MAEVKFPRILFSRGRLLVRVSRHRRNPWFFKGLCDVKPLKYQTVTFVVCKFLLVSWITRRPVPARVYDINNDVWEGTWGWNSESWKDTDIYAKHEPPRLSFTPR